jgi:hypothetical protein
MQSNKQKVLALRDLVVHPRRSVSDGQRPKLAARIWPLRCEVTAQSVLTLEEYVANLQNLRNLAANEGK